MFPYVFPNAFPYVFPPFHPTSHVSSLQIVSELLALHVATLLLERVTEATVSL